MVMQLQPQTEAEIIYPESDGQPMADNTIQFRWITVIYYNLAWLFAENVRLRKLYQHNWNRNANGLNV